MRQQQTIQAVFQDATTPLSQPLSTAFIRAGKDLSPFCFHPLHDKSFD